MFKHDHTGLVLKLPCVSHEALKSHLLFLNCGTVWLLLSNDDFLKQISTVKPIQRILYNDQQRPEHWNNCIIAVDVWNYTETEVKPDVSEVALESSGFQNVFSIKVMQWKQIWIKTALVLLPRCNSCLCSNLNLIITEVEAALLWKCFSVTRSKLSKVCLLKWADSSFESRVTPESMNLLHRSHTRNSPVCEGFLCCWIYMWVNSFCKWQWTPPLVKVNYFLLITYFFLLHAAFDINIIP